MHRLVYIGLVAALNISSISALVVAREKRFDTASFKPTHCQGRSKPTDTVACNIPGLPITGPITLTTPTAPTSWSTPAVTATWQVVYSSDIEVRAEPGVDVYDIDVDSSNATFASLKAANKYIICYFSAGTSESFRSDVGCFNHHLGAQDYGCNFGGDFGNEFWLNTSSLEVRKIMQSRIQHAADRGCSAIDPDNIDGYGNHNGIGATEADESTLSSFSLSKHDRVAWESDSRTQLESSQSSHQLWTSLSTNSVLSSRSVTNTRLSILQAFQSSI